MARKIEYKNFIQEIEEAHSCPLASLQSFFLFLKMFLFVFWVKPLPAEAALGRAHEAPSGSSLSHFFFLFFLFLRKEVEKAWRTQ